MLHRPLPDGKIIKNLECAPIGGRKLKMFYKVDDVFWQDYLSIIGLVIIIIICFLETDQRERSFQLNGVYFRKKYLGLAVFFVALGFAFAHPIYSHIYTPIVQNERGLIGKNGTIYFRHAKVTKMFHTAKSRSCNGVRIELLDGTEVRVPCKEEGDELKEGQVYEAVFSPDLYRLVHFSKLEVNIYGEYADEVLEKDLNLLVQYKKAEAFLHKIMAFCVTGGGVIGMIIVGITSVQKTLKDKRRKK